MSLFERLQKASSEEDVKAEYIKALHLKGVQRNLIDIQTREVWFEAKFGSKKSLYEMFTQLLFYIHKALDDGEYIPPFLCVVDSVKAAIMKTDVALPLLQNKKMKSMWGKSASDVTRDALDMVSQYIGTHFVSFNIETHEQEFIDTFRNAIDKGEIIRTQITPDNLKQVFDKWVEMVGKEIVGASPENYAEFFYADIMSDGTVSTHQHLSAELLHKGNNPVFSLNGKLYELGSTDGYSHFWTIYHRPPEEKHRTYLLERRDSLIPVEERTFKGAYYTPLPVVDKAYDLLEKTLGANWQKNYYVWDMCCGVGNLEAKHSNHRHLFMSTLDEEDVNIMKSAKICVEAERFQYDYLNDDITNDGKIDYNLTDKIPQSLRDVIHDANEGKKKLLVLINPPYAEATSSDNAVNGVGTDASKIGVADTKFARKGMDEFGKASNELYTQFVARISKEIPNATLAMFSTLKHINAQTMEKFRIQWNAKYLGGFIVHCKSFEGLKGEFPIGFLIWKTMNKPTEFPSEISCEILDKNVNAVGSKSFYNIPVDTYLTKWIKRLKPNKELCIPLKNAVTPGTATKDLRGTQWCDNAIAYFWCNSNDMQQAPTRTALFSSGFNGGHGIYVTENNLWQVSVVFTVRKVIPHTWINDRDQFLQPNADLSEEFKNDCLIYMLFNGSNLTASANNLEWNNRKWNIINHFIPFSASEVGASSRFESDFMVRYMRGKTFSVEAQTVLDEGRKIWQEYFKQQFNHKIRDEFKLNRADVGWYQICKALNAQNGSGNTVPTNFEHFEKAYKTLSEKIQPQVYSYGFLK
ncbi:hypothetical protein SAMN05720472_2613 [Fibrobacter sp. UWR3]|uniref:hypothetical protein n=1 Tax=unclassified Fibrobacter TaxID=2634177 RepID=UPI00091727BF|nr:MULTISPECIES: hypothetical protein [unclassified Fibrobacter]SHM91101.1 hypothetical protein SAMN05720472_2613 [Fibrobacter sp. UWR3]SOE75954.1 hypothetical protein SAMN05720781_1880 [Fibrobacter sp. UWT3]